MSEISETSAAEGKLAGQVVVLTGASGGIGLSVTRRFVAEGARVVAVDVAERVIEVTADLGDAVVPVVADISTWAGNATAVRTAIDTWGRLDCLVANAGITDAGRALEDIPGEDLAAAFGELYAVNVLGVLLGARAALPHLIETGGSVIVTGSFAGSNASGGGVLYTSSKHAVEGIVKQLAYEFAPDVRVNGIAPGVAPTRLRGLSALGQGSTDSVYEGTAGVLPLQQVPDVSAYDAAYVLLASSESAVMTGSMVTADSGLAVRGLSRPGGRVRTGQ